MRSKLNEHIGALVGASSRLGRREFLQSLSAGTIGIALPHALLADGVSWPCENTSSFSDIVIEPKRPLSKVQDLKIVENQQTITVSGETFSYGFSKKNGLIDSVKVLHEELTSGRPIPDLTVAEQLNRTISPYKASNEIHANLILKSHAPDNVVIRGEGIYTSETGQQFPLRYAITYKITIDGVVLIKVENTALRDCSFRWLTLSSGAVRSSVATFMSWMPEQATSQHSKYFFRALTTPSRSLSQTSKLLSGVFIPWFWLGNDQVGLELTTSDVTSQTYNQVDGTSRSDENEMFAIFQEDQEIRWENFLIRGSYIWAKAGWQRSGEFTLAITPSKKFDPYYAMIKVGIVGPNQHRPKFRCPDEQQIRTFAQNGYDLLVGLANWRSGEYVPLNEEELRQAISQCHRYGIKVIPYVTLMDLSHATDTFHDHGEEWAIEPTTENFRETPQFHNLDVEMAYRNDPEQETTLMCPGSHGWREHWKRQIDRIVEKYDFDGLYFDFWYGNMVCENARHGCGGSRFCKLTILGAREMMSYAHDKMKARNSHAVFIANTNLLSTALLTSLIDIRLVGEGGDITSMDADSRRWLYSSYRLGEPTEFLWARTEWNDVEKASFAALVNFLPGYYQRPQASPRNGFDDYDVFRYFGAESAKWHLGLSGQGVIQVSPPEVSANIIEKPDRILATLINTSEKPCMAKVFIKLEQVAYDPLNGQMFSAKNGYLDIELAEHAHRHLFFVTRPVRPQVFFILGARSLETENWDSERKALTFSMKAVTGAPLQITLYSEVPVQKITSQDRKAVVFEWSPKTYLAKFNATHEEEARFAAHF